MKMIEPSFMDDIDTDLCGDFFENIDDLLDFPIEDIEGGVTGGDCDGFQGLWPPPMDALPGGSGNVLSDKNSGHGTSELPTELSVPYEDIAQLEWLSNFVEDSFSAGSCTVENYPYEENNKKKDSLCFQTSSPVSVLDSSISCSGGKTMPLGPESFTHGRARSKRPRPATFSPRPVIPLISPTSSMTEPNTGYSASESPFEFESYAESRPSIKISNPIAMEQKKKKKRKLPTPAGAAEQSPAPPQAAAIRKCLHCEITKTPQWRAGPLGPKTLCNACGVRYKSGRLFPEYRPAASPTFVTSLHSNSHKKVIEMRNRATVAVPELVPNSSHLLDYI